MTHLTILIEVADSSTDVDLDASMDLWHLSPISVQGVRLFWYTYPELPGTPEGGVAEEVGNTDPLAVLYHEVSSREIQH